MCATARLIVYSRRGHDWTQTFASIARTAESLPVRHVVLDGEAVVQIQWALPTITRCVANSRANACQLLKPQASLWSLHTIGPIPSTSASLNPFGWRPSKIASTMSGARQVSGRRRHT
jgi:hypothetical protein